MLKKLIFVFQKCAGRSGAIFRQYSEFWAGICDHLTSQTGNSVRKSLLALEGNNAVSAAAAVLDTLGQTSRTQGLQDGLSTPRHRKQHATESKGQDRLEVCAASA